MREPSRTVSFPSAASCLSALIGRAGCGSPTGSDPGGASLRSDELGRMILDGGKRDALGWEAASGAGVQG